MIRLSLSEVAHLLGIGRPLLSRLVSSRIVTSSVPGAGESQTMLQFTPSDLERAAEAVRSLKWLAVVTPDSWTRLTVDGLTYTLLSNRYSRVAKLLGPGHSIAFYVSTYSAFCGVAEIAGATQDRHTVWPHGVFPFRVPLNPKLVCDARTGVKAKLLLEDLRFVENKRAWEQYFRMTIRLLPSEDYVMIERRISDAIAAAAKERTRARSGARHMAAGVGRS
jgi:hypothetical protein